MKTLFFICCTTLILIACQLTDESVDKTVLAGKVERNLTIERDLTVKIMSDIGVGLGTGTFNIKKTDAFLTVSQSTLTRYGGTTPDAMWMLFNNLRTMSPYRNADEIRPSLFQFPLAVGSTWEWDETGSGSRNLQAQVTIEDSETVTVAAGTFPDCLRHKTVFTNTEHEIGLGDTPAFAKVKNALVNGTRYLWFAKGVGLVKMRYEHSNGIVTEAELIDHQIPGSSDEYLPLNPGTIWTYRWYNTYYDETFIEKVQISDKDGPSSNQIWRDLNVKVTTEEGEDLREGVFSIIKTDSALALKLSVYSGLSTTKSSVLLKQPLINNIAAYHETDLLRFPCTVGKTWTQPGSYRSLEAIAIEGFEEIKTPAGTFQNCLKQKTVRTGATAGTAEENALVNGTRYLWFAKGIGIVKVRYEHANGVVTEAELTESHVPRKNEEYLPLTPGTTWTYKWKNKYHPKGIIEKFDVVGSVDTQRIVNPENGTVFKKAAYVISVDSDDPGRVKVTCQLTPKEAWRFLKIPFRRPLKVRLHLHGHGAYIRDVTLVDGSGRKPSARRSNTDIWEFTFRRDTHEQDIEFPLTLSYNASLAQDRRQWVSQPPPGTLPFSRLGTTLWTSNELFIVGKQTDEIEVAFKLPESWWRVSTPWQPIGDTGTRFAVTDQTELTNAALFIGQHAETRAKSGKAEVVLAISSRPKAYQDTMLNTVEQFLHRYSEVFNGEPEGRFVFFINPDKKKVGNQTHGYGTGNSVRFSMDWTLDDATKHEWAPFLGHEVFHIWNGHIGLKPFSAKELWFREGVTNYYADITSARLGYLSESEFLKRLAYAYENYLSVRPEFAIIDGSTDARLSLAGGSLVAAVLDLQIRHLTKNQKNLNHVMQRMYREFGNTTKRYTQRDIIQTVNKVTGADFEPFFQTYVTGNQRLPLSEYFNYAGLDVQIEYSEELPTTYYVYDVLKANIQQENWRLTAVNGRKVEGFADLRESAKTWKSGDVLEVTIEENSETITLPVTLSGMIDHPPTARDANVRITKQTETTELQRTILANILRQK